MSIAQNLVSLLQGYRVGMSYDALVEVMRDVATGVTEAYSFEDGSSIILDQDDRDEEGIFRRIRVLTDQSEEIGSTVKRKKKKEGKGE